MNNFQDREKAFEAKFAHDEELRFKVDARRNKLLGLWLADKMGKTGDDAESYAKEVVIADLKEAGDADVIEKVMADIKEANLSITEDEIVKKLSEFFVAAGEELAS